MSIAIGFWLQGELWHLIAQTGLVARIVLIILFGFSVFSWSIIFKKYKSFKIARRDSHEFLRVFRQSKKLSDIRASCQALKASPLVEVFLAGYREIETQAVPSENPGRMKIKSLVSIQRSLQIASSGELTRLEQYLSWLATTGSTMPFVGLFGTVWGIIDSFRGLGSAGTASLRTVAPGIAEALIATAAGLLAAIPAVIAYNHFLQRIKEFGALMDDFSLEFMNMTERYFS